MIRRIAIRGYKSLRDVKLELDPLTVVIGPNAAGKSNLLDAIGLLSRTAEGDLQSAFTGHRGDPLHSFTFDERGIDGLLAREDASFRIDADIELSADTVNRVNRTITEAREGYEPARALVREELLRYSLEVRIVTASGVLQVVDESVRALNKNMDVIVVGIDADCYPRGERGQQVERACELERYEGRVIVAEPDPHIEAWYLADPAYVQRLLHAPDRPAVPDTRCLKREYKDRLRATVRSSGAPTPLGGVEYGPEIAADMDLHRAGRNAPSLRRFTDEARAWLRGVR